MEGYLEENKKTLTNFLAIEEASRCLLCYDAPCSKACPAGTDPGKFIRSLRFRNLKGAIETIRTNNPLGGICARVCPYDKYCEGACSRCGIDKPIKIGDLQRYLTDYEKNSNMKVMEKSKLDKEKVAVIGSGPSGLSVAAILSQKGYKVTVFEQKEILGGWLSYGIPPKRLPQEVVENEINHLKDLEIEFKTNCKIGNQVNIDSLRKDGYKAFLIACGIQKSKSIEVNGTELKGIINGVDFLSEAKIKKGNIKVGIHVVVIGGGDVAMDCASTAKLLGAEDVKIVYRRTIEKMPSSIEERQYVQGVLNIPIFTGFKPVEILGKSGKVTALKAKGMFDDSSMDLEADMIIVAVGQEIDDMDSIIDIKSEDVFTAGDIVEKDKTVVQSVGSGKLAAERIDAYLTEIRNTDTGLGEIASVKEGLK
ncbi:dihydropyrimidine dehydrogenase [Clostridium carboxidivorans P7]|uniref:dihydrouracil dehydrogenase (NAD(+)) n=1 Tax=Clostridium carboxidivorans P7 TaxID=536227 RepID=C6Q1G1_9CLOT|nr:FAD-dependent oxidoreductase [Clostridium carboxidivorans]AKN33679.1 dihydropyrimidine dehydrogenase [Clostridium carboxidivorans P7]EET84662.1 FAD-dependent pyridine nucleotide-disulphide oxidoreductase [Clostridium carboxidivorans P7]EFG86725.1 pyridine nucleotide-disulfide oxidoreductase [Clostridium carboxidivorans P7]